MAIQEYSLTTIKNGIAALPFEPQEGEYTGSQGIDPDLAIDILGTGNLSKYSGLIYPTLIYFLNSSITSDLAVWILSNPNTLTFSLYDQSGGTTAFNPANGTANSTGTVSSSTGNGAAYYNNYYYYANGVDVFRYGPLDGSSSGPSSYWQAGGGANKSALQNTTYPAPLSGVKYPNHAMHYHQADGKLYFCDYKNGQGLIHYILTKKVTNIGDTDNGSTYAALTLPFNCYPSDIESWGNDLAILCFMTKNTYADGIFLKQGDSVLFLWDTFSLFPYQMIPIKMSLATALLNNNGILHGWGGNVGGGTTKFSFTGGSNVNYDSTFPASQPPSASQVDGLGDMIAWVGDTEVAVSGKVVYTQNSPNPREDNSVIHCRSTCASFSGVGCLKFMYDDPARTSLIGGVTSNTVFSTENLSGFTRASLNSIFMSPIWTVGQPFNVQKIAFNFNLPISSADTISVTLYIDQTAVALTTVNNTNYANQTNIVYNVDDIAAAIKTAAVTLIPSQTVFVLLTWSGSRANPILPPIRVEVDTLTDGS